MIVETTSGKTEVYFKDFADQEPKLYEIRQQYREQVAASKSDKAREKAAETASIAVGRLFGMNRYLEDWKISGAKTVEEWDAWINAKPLAYRKLYYSGEVVAKCVMGPDE